MKQTLHNLRLNLGYQIRVLLIPAVLLTFTNFATAQVTLIPDANFEQALIDLTIDSDGTVNGQVFTADISGVTTLNVNSKNISDLTGIEDFSSLQFLDCKDNLIAGSIDLSMLTSLTSISFYNNQLSSINVTGLTNLTYLELWINQLTSLDVSSNTNLTYLDCDQNEFTSLDVSVLTGLVTFYCNTNKLTSLDLRGLNSLTTFQCTVNPFLSCVAVDNIIVPGGWLKDAITTYCTVTTWNGAWDNGTPTVTNSAVIASTYSVAADITACSLTIKNNATVTVPSTFNVNLNGSLIVEAGSTFTLSNDTNLVQTNINSVNSGVINVNRNSNDLFRLDYTLWSSPVSGAQTLADFSPLTSSTRFYIYDNTLGATGLYSPIASTIPFATGTGYLIRMPNTGSVAYNDGTESLIYNGTFTGTANNGTITLPVTSDAYSAIGNPYPSTINADLFLSGNSITSGTDALYFWRKKNGPSSSYATYTTAGGTSNFGGDPLNLVPNGTIQVGQGFIAKSTSASLEFTNAMRTTTNGSQMFKTRPIERNRIWLNLSKDNAPINQMMIAYMTGATQGIDAAIDGRYFNDSPTALNSFLNNEEFVIQGRSLPFDGTDVVSLAFKTETAGSFTIAIDHYDGLFSGTQDIYLVDASNGTQTNLKTSAYTFTAAAGVDNARFSLKYQKTLKVEALSFDINSVNIYKNKGTLSVNSKVMPIDNIKVFDIQGRLIAEQKNVKSNSAIITTLKDAPQVLIVKVTGEDKSVVNKKVMN